MACDYRPLKSDLHCVWLIVGDNKLEYPNNVASPSASLLETNLLLNSTIIDASKGACCITMNIKDCFLQMTTFTVELKKGMHRLKKATRLAYNDLV